MIKILYRIKSISIRLVNYYGMDEHGCLMISEYHQDSISEFIGLGILFEKEYYSDSTEITHIGAIEEGIDGIEQKIEKFEFKCKSTIETSEYDLSGIFRGNPQFCCLSWCCNIHASLNHRLLGRTDDSLKNCYFSVYYPVMADLVNEVNSNSRQMLGTSGLYGEIFFWVSAEEFRDRFSINDLIRLNFELSDSTIVSDSIIIKRSMLN